MIEILNGETVLVPVDELVPHPANPRVGDVTSIRESMEVNGFYGFLIVQQSTRHVLAGNHRLLAAKLAGASEVPVVWVDVSDEVALRILAADNRTNDLAGYNEEALVDLLKSITAGSGSLDGTGYDPGDLDALIASVSGPLDDSAEPSGDELQRLREKWATEEGQLWQIGSRARSGKVHRVICGDATDAAVVARLLGEAVPALMVTDPPYGVKYDPGWRTAAGVSANSLKMGKVLNDDRADWTPAWDLFPGYVAYVWHGGLHSSTVASSLVRTRFQIRAQIIWAKDRFALSRGHYHWHHEPCWYGERVGARWFDWVLPAPRLDHVRPVLHQEEHQACWYGIRQGAGRSWNGSRSESTVWSIPAREDGGHGHGTQKPIECMARPIRNHKGDVYDPFLGSGTTLFAAEGLGRACFGVELDPSYLAVILERASGRGMVPELVDGNREEG